MLHLDLETAKRLVSDIIAREGGDKVYKRPYGEMSCLYVHQGETGEWTRPGCLVGHVLMEHGVPAEDMARKPMEVEELSELLGRMKVLSIEPDAVEYLEVLQDRQDIQVPWGEANDYALQKIHGQ